MTTSFHAHAVSCGINMTAKAAVALFDSDGYLVMVDIIHPVTREVIIHAGTTMDNDLVLVCDRAGVDYVIVYHRPFPSQALEDYTTREILNELIAHMEHTNGLYFCSVTSILQAREMLTAHLAAVCPTT